MNQFISLAPATVYSLNDLTPERLIYTSEVPFPLIPLPLYVRGMTTIAARERWLISLVSWSILLMVSILMRNGAISSYPI